MATSKKRIDLILVQKKLVPSRQRAQALIMAGKVLVNEQPVVKPGMPVSESDVVKIKGNDIPYVSRGGLKLEAALDAFRINPANHICLDAGASTGGFTDCLLQRGASTVFAVDVGYGQLAWKLRRDDRVIPIERTNIRYMAMEAIPYPIDLVTIDVSFISLKVVVPEVFKFMKRTGSIIALIKPQFEVGRTNVGKGGVVRDPEQHEGVIRELTCFFTQCGLLIESVTPSPITGPKGNREFLIHLKNEPTVDKIKFKA